ncbi:ferrous iron transport protein A [Streptomyces longwoodensis]|uniref:FeoA family protein n=1 Tax=Streptomyces longwoodensis TaxID=68231 RepID=UPI00370170DC
MCVVEAWMRGGDAESELTGGLPTTTGNDASQTLADMVPGTRITVVAVVVDGAPDVARRLADLGFTPGTLVEVVRRAPLRDPVVYRVKDYEVCLRREQAACVRTVEVHG